MLSDKMLFNPGNFHREQQVLSRLPASLVVTVFVDPMAMVITEYHRATNIAREAARGHGRHGSCGQGVGETVQDSLGPHGHMIIRPMFFESRALVRGLLEFWRDKKAEEIADLGQPVPDFFRDDRFLEGYLSNMCGPQPYMVLADVNKDAFIDRRDVVYEGAQGVLLDEDVGFHPYTTWSRSRPINAFEHADKWNLERPHSIGVTRTYMTRHGAGPFVTEDASLRHPELHNDTNPHQGSFRLGHFDLVALKYAIGVSGIDSLAVNHLDRIGATVKVCVGYSNMDAIPVIDPYDFEAREKLTQRLFEATPIYEEWPGHLFLQHLYKETGVPISIIGAGPGIHTNASMSSVDMFGQRLYTHYGQNPDAVLHLRERS